MSTCVCQQGPGIQVIGCAQAAQAASQAILLFLDKVRGVLRSQTLFPTKKEKIGRTPRLIH